MGCLLERHPARRGLACVRRGERQEHHGRLHRNDWAYLRTEARPGHHALQRTNGRRRWNSKSTKVGWETERCRMAQATAPILDSTEPVIHVLPVRLVR